MSTAELRRLVIVATSGAAAVFIAILVATALGEGGGGEREAVGPKIGDHWHAPYAIFILGTRLPAIPEMVTKEGVHTHGDGVIHIHPFLPGAEGEGAGLANFFAAMGGELTNTRLRIPDEINFGPDIAIIRGELRDGVIVNGERVTLRILRADGGIHPLGSGFDAAIRTCNAKPESEFETVHADYVPQDGDCIRIVFGPPAGE